MDSIQHESTEYSSLLTDAALGYYNRGWQPVAVAHKGKEPLDKEWQKTDLTEQQVRERFEGGPQKNLGIRLGDASGGLADVDLDAREGSG